MRERRGPATLYGPEADISGPQGKSEDQPHAKQIAPAEGVTPPAEVHACPTVHSAPCTTRYRCLPESPTWTVVLAARRDASGIAALSLRNRRRHRGARR